LAGRKRTKTKENGGEQRTENSARRSSEKVLGASAHDGGDRHPAGDRDCVGGRFALGRFNDSQRSDTSRH
jgi:hypothetical protein